MPLFANCVAPGPSMPQGIFLQSAFVTSTVAKEWGLLNWNTTMFPLIPIVLDSSYVAANEWCTYAETDVASIATTKRGANLLFMVSPSQLCLSTTSYSGWCR